MDTRHILDKWRIRDAVIYIRVSTEKQADEGISMEMQEKMALEFCAKRGLDIRKDGIYRDGGRSGGSLAGRPEFDKMRKEMIPLTAVIVYDISRFARNETDQNTIMDEFLAKKCPLILLTNPDLDPESPEGRLMYTMLGGFGSYFRKELMRKTRHARQEKIKTYGTTSGDKDDVGARLKTRAIYGYRSKGHKMGFEQVPEEQKVVLQIRNAVRLGYNDYQISLMLDKCGIPTRKNKKGECAKKWYSEQIRRIREHYKMSVDSEYRDPEDKESGDEDTEMKIKEIPFEEENAKDN